MRTLEGLALALGILALPVVPMAQQKPNIVWITIEDTSPDFIGCYGNREVRTPNIDALAAEGVRFTNAFSTNTVCSPSRHTIITGVRTVQDGCGNHRSTFKVPSYVKGLAHYLKEGGYFTTNNQKTDYNLDNPKAFIAQNWVLQGGKADFTKRQDKTQPFFSVFNFNESHQSRTVGNSRGWYEKEILSQLSANEVIRPEALTVPPFYQDDADNRRNIARLYNCLQVTDKRVGDIIRMIKDAGEWDNTIVFFFADHGQGMPRFKTNASRLGTQVPMVVRLPERYRRLLAVKPGSTYEDLVTFEDLAPTMINITTGAHPPSYMTGRIFMGPQQQPTNNVYWGSRDNTDEVIDMGRTLIKGDYVYTRIYYPHLAVLQHQAYYERSDMLKEMRADFAAHTLDSLQASIFSPRSAEYLFNRRTDKWETHNLAGDKKYAGLLAEMRRLNQQKMRTYQDVGFLPETVIGQIDGGGDTILTWKKTHYHVDKYMAVAEMVGRGKGFLPQQLALLSDKDSVIRYWAVIGLHNQQTRDLERAVLQKAFAREPSDFVKVELAEMLYDHFRDETYLQWLTDIISRSSNPYIRRQAAMKLANHEELPPAIVEQVRTIRDAMSQGERTDMAYPIRAALGTVVHAKVEDDDN